MTPPIRMVSVPLDVATEAVNCMARAYERVHSLPRVSDTELANRVGVAKEALRIVLAAAPVREEGGAVLDELYERAKTFATRDKASTSYLQRRLQISFKLASDLMERMEREGLVSKRNASGLRSILVPYDAAGKKAGEPMTEAEVRQWIEACNHEPARQVLRDYLATREEAQPVAKPAPFDQGGIGHAMYQAFHAYRADYVLSTDGADYVPTPFERDLIEDFFAGLMAEEAFFGPIRALYGALTTPPAPEAEKMRVAVEALEAEKDWHERIADFAYDEARECSARGEKTYECAAMIKANAHTDRADIIRKALAALQREGR